LIDVQYFQAITGSVKGKIELEIIIAVNRSIQVACFVLPFTVLLGWIIGTEMSLLFNGFETTALFTTVLYISLPFFADKKP
jgi:Ca2+:H+ antiporter